MPNEFARGGRDGANLMTPRLDWNADGHDWPNRAASRFVTAGGVSWHVQVMGEGAPMLLLHGTAPRRTRSPILRDPRPPFPGDRSGSAGACVFRCGGVRGFLSTTGMAQGVAQLCKALGVAPAVIVGHSAGAAVAIRATIDGQLTPKLIVSINGAVMALRGLAGHLFSPMAKLMSFNWFMPWIFATRAGDDQMIDRLLEGTGSTMSPATRAFLCAAGAQPASRVVGVRHDGELGSAGT